MKIRRKERNGINDWIVSPMIRRRRKTNLFVRSNRRRSKFRWSVESETKRKNDWVFLFFFYFFNDDIHQSEIRVVVGRNNNRSIRIIIGMPYRLRISAWGNRTDKNELCRWMLRRCRRCIKPTQLAHSPSLSIHWRGRHARRDCGPEIRTVPMFHLWHFVQSHASDIRRCLISW